MILLALDLVSHGTVHATTAPARLAPRHLGTLPGVNNVTFRDAVMHHTDKGVYIKFRKLKGGVGSGSITNILYENILIEEPESWYVPSTRVLEYYCTIAIAIAVHTSRS